MSHSGALSRLTVGAGERHDQMGIAQSDWQDREGTGTPTPATCATSSTPVGVPRGSFSAPPPWDVSGVTSKTQADAKNERS
jgi:hypothetical protein